MPTGVLVIGGWVGAGGKVGGALVGGTVGNANVGTGGIVGIGGMVGTDGKVGNGIIVGAGARTTGRVLVAIPGNVILFCAMNQPAPANATHPQIPKKAKMPRTKKMPRLDLRGAATGAGGVGRFAAGAATGLPHASQ